MTSTARTNRMRPTAAKGCEVMGTAEKLVMFVLFVSVVLVGACTDPPAGAPSCEEARAEAFVMSPPFACRIVDWPRRYTMYPLPAGDLAGTSLIPVGDGTEDMYAGPAQYNELLKEPGVLASTPDGNCAWLPCHGGVNPIDAGID